MSPFLRSYLTVVWFGLASFLIAGLLLGISALLRPDKPSAEKLMPYESGVDPVGEGWSQSQIRYYVYALLFVIFDVEVIFLYPWAVVFTKIGVIGLIEMLIFIGLFVVAYVYAPSVFLTMNGASIPSMKTHTAPSLSTARPFCSRSATTTWTSRPSRAVARPRPACRCRSGSCCRR